MQRYQNNAFRVLGLTANATHAEILRRGNEIKVKKSLGVELAFEYDFLWMGPIDRSEENIIRATQRLDDPVSRLREELCWFWVHSETDKEALLLLSENKKAKAHDLWGELLASSSLSNNEKCSAFINQAILAHSSVMWKESLVKYSEKDNCLTLVILKGENSLVCPRCHTQYDKTWKVCLHCGIPLADDHIVVQSKRKNAITLDEGHWKNWKFSMNRFLYVIYQDFFRNTIRKRVKSISDPRLSAQKAGEICDGLFPSMIDPNLSYIAQALIAKDYERVKKHSSILNGLDLNPLFDSQQLGPATVKAGFNKVLSYHINSLNMSVETLRKELSSAGSGSGKNVFIKMYDDFSAKGDVLLYEANLIDMNSNSNFTLSRDNAAEALRNLSVAIHNQFCDYAKAYEIIQKALTYAVASHLRQRCEIDANTVKSHLDLSRSGAIAAAPSGNNSGANILKKIPIGVWVWGVIIGVAAIASISDSTKTTQLPSQSASTNYNIKIPQYVTEKNTSLSDLETRITNLKATISWQEGRIDELRAMATRTGSRLDYLKREINNIELTYGSSSYIPDYIRNDYNNKIQEHNSLLSTYNGYIYEAQNLYNECEGNIQECNRLVGIYNRRR